MKIQIASDLHLEFMRHYPDVCLVDRDTDADVLVLAGDIHLGAGAVRYFAEWNKPVVMVQGNHEGYGRDWEQVRRDLRDQCKGTAIYFLDNGKAVIDGVRFLGATLWTDFTADGVSVAATMRNVSNCLNDFQIINSNGAPFTADMSLIEHNQTVGWLGRELDKPFEGKTVVVTHHGPHTRSIHPRWRSSMINGGFVSDLSPLLEKCPLWIHGHVHDSFDYQEKGCRVIANPHGYVLNLRGLPRVADFERENPAYRPDLVVEI